MLTEKNLLIETNSLEIRNGSKLILQGYLDADTVDILKDKLNCLIQVNKINIIIDLKDLTFIGCSGWETIRKFGLGALERGGRVVLVNMSDKIERTYNMLGLSAFLPSFKDEPEAVCYLEQKS